MTTWEYKVFGTVSSRLEDDLANHGKAGWELISVDRNARDAKVTLIFKRPCGPVYPEYNDPNRYW